MSTPSPALAEFAVLGIPLAGQRAELIRLLRLNKLLVEAETDRDPQQDLTHLANTASTLLIAAHINYYPREFYTVDAALAFLTRLDA